MYAIVHTLLVRDRNTNLTRLHDEVLPAVRSLPGFVSGSWLQDDSTGRALAVVTFDTLPAAQAAAEGLTSHGHDDIDTTGVEIYQVLAHT